MLYDAMTLITTSVVEHVRKNVIVEEEGNVKYLSNTDNNRHLTLKPKPRANNYKKL